MLNVKSYHVFKIVSIYIFKTVQQSLVECKRCRICIYSAYSRNLTKPYSKETKSHQKQRRGKDDSC